MSIFYYASLYLNLTPTHQYYIFSNTLALLNIIFLDRIYKIFRI